MMTALKVIALVVLALIVVGAALRLRKVARDRRRESSPSSSGPRMVEPPPSPYAPSRGFRVINGVDADAPRPHAPTPRIDPSHQYVFSDAQPADFESLAPAITRHSEDWYLAKSTHRDPGVRTLVVVLAVIAVAIVIVGALYFFGRAPRSTTTTTSTSVVRATHATTTTVRSLGPTSVSGSTIAFDVTGPTYQLDVTAVGGASSVVVRNAHHAVVWRGDLATGASRNLSVSGTTTTTVSRVENVSVREDGTTLQVPASVTGSATLLTTPAG